MSDQGLKYDTGKPALDLIEPEFELELGAVLTYGAMKYEKDQWKKGMSLGKCLAGVLRHINAIRRGEFVDKESGLKHTAHAVAGLMFVAHYVRNGALETPDDRWTTK